MLLQALARSGHQGPVGHAGVPAPAGGWHLRPVLEVPQGELLAFGKRAGVDAHEDPDERAICDSTAASCAGRSGRRSRRAGRAPPPRCRAPPGTRPRRRSCWTRPRMRRYFACATATRCRCPGLRALPEIEQINVLRRWMGNAGIVPPPSTARMTRGPAADSRRAGRSLAGDRVGQPCAAALPAESVPDAGDRRRARRAVGTGRARPARGSIWDANLGDSVLGRATGGLDVARLPESLIVRRRDGGESLKPAPKPGRRVCSTCVNRMGCCRGCAMRCPWYLRATRLICRRRPVAGRALGAIGAAVERRVSAMRWEQAPIIVG